MKQILSPLIVTVALFGTLSFGSAQSPEEKARNLMTKYKPSLVVVTVKGKIITTTTGDPLPPREQQRRTLGCTIADNGLIVVSNSAIDSAIGLEGQKAQVDNNKIVTIKTAKSEFSDVEISYGDATLLHGKVVRQDATADVAFILPDQAEAKALKKKFTKIDLTQFAAAAQPADQVVALSRSSGVFGYMPTLSMGRISGVYKSDRVYFVNNAGTSQGMPVFTLDGKLLGITLTRVVDGQPTGILAALSAGSIQVMANLANG